MVVEKHGSSLEAVETDIRSTIYNLCGSARHERCGADMGSRRTQRQLDDMDCFGSWCKDRERIHRFTVRIICFVSLL